MFPYWLLFAYFAAGSFLHRDSPRRGADSYPLLTVGALLIALMIGLRYQVGADWLAYRRMYEFAGRADFQRIILLEDPGYQLLNWLAQQASLQLWAVNLACGTIFSWGLLRFCRGQPLPWLAFLVAIPYLCIVVAMGYSRQGVAIGIILSGLAAVQRGASGLRFAAYVLVAALFHRTAVVVLPLVLFSGHRTRTLNFIVALAILVLAYDLFVARAAAKLFQGYLDTALSSQGAAIRVALIGVPAVLFLLNRRRFAFPPRDDLVWRNLALAALFALAALLVVRSSTAVDRVSLYLLPLELVIFSRIPLVFQSPIFGRAAVIGLCALIQFVWLNFAVHAQAWIPYRFFPVGT